MQLRTDNFATLTTKGALRDIRQHIPQTIVDAIHLLRSLNERYLWVDGLCLKQDDDDDVSLGISMMDSIYRGSYFTIVAASGDDANAGLPALNRTIGLTGGQGQYAARVAPKVKMTAIRSIDWHLERSTYHQRGWTLQELVLPSRTLIFVNGQVYYRCQEANWSEDTCADQWCSWLDDDDNHICRLPDALHGFTHSCWSYQKLCENFSKRELRQDGDALRAFAGIIRPTAIGMNTPTVEGLPAYFLDHFLLFISSDGNMRRRDRFASYSWAGWAGAKLWPRENFEWPFMWNGALVENRTNIDNIIMHLKHHRLISWYALDSRGQRTSLTRNKRAPVMEFAIAHPDIISVPDPCLLDASYLKESDWDLGLDSHNEAPNWEDKCLHSTPMHRLSQLQIPYSRTAMEHVKTWTELEKIFEHMDNIAGKSIRRDNWMRHRRRSMLPSPCSSR